MHTNLAKIARRNSIAVAILIIMAIMVVFGFLAFFPSDLLKTFFAVIAITLAVALPIHQKHFSLYSIFLVASGSLFLMSSVVDNAYQTVVSPLPVLQQIEFSKIIRPMQVSRGSWHVGIGVLYMLISFAGLQTKETSEKPKTKRSKFFLSMMAVIGVLYSVLGIISIVEGMSKL